MSQSVETFTYKVQMYDGVQLNVKILGEVQASPKPLLIALHSAPGASNLAEAEGSSGFFEIPFASRCLTLVLEEQNL